MADSKYSWSASAEGSFHGEFNTITDALREGFGECPERQTIYVGQNRKPDPLDAINGEDLINRIYDYEDFGIEEAADWPNYSPTQEADLTEMLRGAFKRWMDRYDLHPQFWIVEEIKEYDRNYQVIS